VGNAEPGFGAGGLQVEKAGAACKR